MLVLSTTSTCDVCLEPFKLESDDPEELRVPFAIECGHVFCIKCIDNLGRLSCPLCRTYFDPRSVRRLHVDMQSAPDPDDEHSDSGNDSDGYHDSDPDEPAGYANNTARVNSNPEDEGKRHLTARLVSLVRQGAEGPEFQAILKETKDWLMDRPDEHWDLRALYLLLIRYQEMHKEHQDAQVRIHEMNKEQRDWHAKMHELEEERDEWHSRADTEAMVAQHQIKKLESTMEEQRQTALAVERTLREHYDRMDEEWSQKYQSVLKEVRSLQDQVRLLTFSGPSAVHNHHTSVSKPNFPSIDQVAFPSKQRSADRADEIAKPVRGDHFSPLPAHLSPYPVIMKGFSPLFKARDADSSDQEAEIPEEDESSDEFDRNQTRSRSRLASEGEPTEDASFSSAAGSSDRRSSNRGTASKPGAIPIPQSNLARLYDIQSSTSQSPDAQSHSIGDQSSSHSMSNSHSSRDYTIPPLTHSNSSSSTISSTILTPDVTGSGPVSAAAVTGATGAGAPSSLPHPHPATYLLKRHEKRERDYSTIPRHYSTSSRDGPPSIVPSSSVPRQSKLKPTREPSPSPSSSPEPRFAEVVDSGDESGRVVERRQALDALLSDLRPPINLPNIALSPPTVPTATITSGESPYEKDVQVRVVNPARESRREPGRTSSRNDREQPREREREREKESRQHRPQATPSPVPPPPAPEPIPTPSTAASQQRVFHASEAAQAIERERQQRKLQSQNAVVTPAPSMTPSREAPGARPAAQQDGSYFPQVQSTGGSSRSGTSRGATYGESQSTTPNYGHQSTEMSREYSHGSGHAYGGEYQEPSRSKRSQRDEGERRSSGKDRDRERDGRDRRREERERLRGDRDRDRDWERERNATSSGVQKRQTSVAGEA